MNPMDLKAENVRKELEILIQENPDRYGTVDGEDPNKDPGNVSCVYFKDDNGTPIRGGVTTNLVTPICIVGTWIDRFHPEFKDVPDIQRELITNVGVSSWNDVDEIIPEDVAEILLTAQIQQDKGKAWGQIDLNQMSSDLFNADFVSG